MDLLIGLVLALVIGIATRGFGLDRDRALYPIVTMVIASYYLLFAVMAGSTAALIADGRYNAEDDVADLVLVQVGVARADLVDQSDDEVDGLDLVQRAVLLLAARRADRLVDEGFFGHV